MDSVAVYLCFCLSLISWFISARLIVIMSTSSSNTCSGKGRVRSNFFSRLSLRLISPVRSPCPFQRRSILYFNLLRTNLSIPFSVMYTK